MKKYLCDCGVNDFSWVENSVTKEIQTYRKKGIENITKEQEDKIMEAIKEFYVK